MKKGFTLIELMIVVAIIAVIAAIAIPNLMESTIATNESAATKSLATMQDAEEKYFNNDFDADNIANYCATIAGLYNLADRGGNRVDLIPPALGQANAPATAYKGYYFNEIADLMATRQTYGFCANPAEYGQTGRKTFIINKSGTIYLLDQGNVTPIVAWPDVSAWQTK